MMSGSRGGCVSTQGGLAAGDLRHDRFLRRFSDFHHGIPCERWLRALVNRIDPALFGRCFNSWTAAFWPNRHEFIAIDRNGEGSIMVAGSVLRQNVTAGSVVMGNPAKVVARVEDIIRFWGAESMVLPRAGLIERREGGFRRRDGARAALAAPAQEWQERPLGRGGPAKSA